MYHLTFKFIFKCLNVLRIRLHIIPLFNGVDRDEVDMAAQRLRQGDQFPGILFRLAMGISFLRFSSVVACKDNASVICSFSSASCRILGTIPQVDTVTFL